MKLFLRFVILILVISSLIGLFSYIYWLFDLFNHFRVHALFASISLCLLVVCFDIKSSKFAFLLLCFNAILFFIPLYSTGGISSLSDSVDEMRYINIVSSNVHTVNEEYSRAIDVVVKESPDIIAFMETDARWIENLSSLEGSYPYTMKRPRLDNFGMAIYSKLPFQANILAVGNYRLPLAVLKFDHFTLIVAHPIPPISRTSAGENELYINVIAEISLASKKPVIVAGDLNSTLWGKAVTPLINAGFQRVNPMGVAYTWPVKMPLFAMQIDHFFARHITSADFKVLDDIGSDHYPIQAIFNIPQMGSQGQTSPKQTTSTPQWSE